MSSGRSTGRKESLGADLVIPALALAFAIYFFFSIADLAWEAKANGLLIGTVLVVLIGIQLARTGIRVARGTGALTFDRLLQPHYAQRKRIGMVLITVAFMVAMPWLGLTLALFLAMLAALYVMGVRKVPVLFWVSFGVSASAYLMFVALLASDIPHGPVEKLLALLLQSPPQ